MQVDKIKNKAVPAIAVIAFIACGYNIIKNYNDIENKIAELKKEVVALQNKNETQEVEVTAAFPPGEPLMTGHKVVIENDYGTTVLYFGDGSEDNYYVKKALEEDGDTEQKLERLQKNLTADERASIVSNVREKIASDFDFTKQSFNTFNNTIEGVKSKKVNP